MTSTLDFKWLDILQGINLETFNGLYSKPIDNSTNLFCSPHSLQYEWFKEEIQFSLHN